MSDPRLLRGFDLLTADKFNSSDALEFEDQPLRQTVAAEQHCSECCFIHPKLSYSCITTLTDSGSEAVQDRLELLSGWSYVDRHRYGRAVALDGSRSGLVVPINRKVHKFLDL